MINYLINKSIQLCIEFLKLTLLNLDISCFANSVDPDQLASEKPADHDTH